MTLGIQKQVNACLIINITIFLKTLSYSQINDDSEKIQGQKETRSVVSRNDWRNAALFR
mgnify:FL=1